MKTLIVIVCALFVNVTVAETYVQINGVSVHDRSGFNGINYGAGIEQTVLTRWSVAGGWYRNSEYRGSTYGYARYAVYKDGPWDIGVAVGAVTGYQRAPVVPMAFPEVCYGWTCALILPRVDSTGASAIGLRLRIPIN